MPLKHFQRHYMFLLIIFTSFAEMWVHRAPHAVMTEFYMACQLLGSETK